MSEQARNWLYVSAIAVLASILIFSVSTEPESASRAEHIGSRIKCPVCQGESIADSPAQMARDMMSLVEERLGQGASDSEIEAELLASYSGAVLLDPPVSGQTLALWLAPLAVAAVGVGVILRWKNQKGDDVPPQTDAEPKGRVRMVTGAFILGGALAAVVAFAATSLQDRDSGATGVADQDIEDVEDVSDETLEAVIAANSDHPQINGMRLALAERYYESGDYRAAFPHYLAVADSGTATEQEMITSLVRLGWMAYDGNGESETALSLFDQALEIDPESQAVRYLKGTVLWCGLGSTIEALDLFTSLLDDPQLPDDTRAQIEDDVHRLQSEGSCV